MQAVVLSSKLEVLPVLLWDSEQERVLLRAVRPHRCPSPLEGGLEAASTKLIASFYQVLICNCVISPQMRLMMLVVMARLG